MQQAIAQVEFFQQMENRSGKAARVGRPLLGVRPRIA
jgi:hypothetical protein